jgi:hypothetical protein
MSRSINPICLGWRGEAEEGFAPSLIVLMSLRPDIPWRVALQQSPPPLHRPESMLYPTAAAVNHHPTRAGGFSTGDVRNSQPAVTTDPKRSFLRHLRPAWLWVVELPRVQSDQFQRISNCIPDVRWSGGNGSRGGDSV